MEIQIGYLYLDIHDYSMLRVEDFIDIPYVGNMIEITFNHEQELGLINSISLVMGIQKGEYIFMGESNSLHSEAING